MTSCPIAAVRHLVLFAGLLIATHSASAQSAIPAYEILEWEGQGVTIAENRGERALLKAERLNGSAQICAPIAEKSATFIARPVAGGVARAIRLSGNLPRCAELHAAYGKAISKFASLANAFAVFTTDRSKKYRRALRRTAGRRAAVVCREILRLKRRPRIAHAHWVRLPSPA